MAGAMERVDAYQQAHPWLGFPFGVYKKFGDDRAGNLAALISYYTFFSIFPLLMVLVTILGYVLAGHPDLQQQVAKGALGQFPIIGAGQARTLTGSPAALIIGLILAIWSGLAVAHTGQTAFNTVYDVPRTQWPGFAPKLLRSVELVIVGGFGLILTTLVQGAVSGSGNYGLPVGTGTAVAGAIVGIVLNMVVFTYLFRRLTVRALRNRDVIVGAAIDGVAWFVLQKVGTNLVSNKVNGAQGTYGTFAVVIGLLFWFYLLAQITLYCAEVNVVRSQQLWPRGLRSMSGEATTDADRRAYEAYPQRERLAHNMIVEVHPVTEEERPR